MSKFWLWYSDKCLSQNSVSILLSILKLFAIYLVFVVFRDLCAPVFEKYSAKERLMLFVQPNVIRLLDIIKNFNPKRCHPDEKYIVAVFFKEIRGITLAFLFVQGIQNVRYHFRWKTIDGQCPIPLSKGFSSVHLSLLCFYTLIVIRFFIPLFRIFGNMMRTWSLWNLCSQWARLLDRIRLSKNHKFSTWSKRILWAIFERGIVTCWWPLVYWKKGSTSPSVTWLYALIKSELIATMSRQRVKIF